MPPDRLTVIALDGGDLPSEALRVIAGADVLLAPRSQLGAARHLATPRVTLREAPADPDALADVAAACSGTVAVLADEARVGAVAAALADALPAGRVVVLGDAA
ncbi:MAG: hypothetical protein ACQETV_04940 [Actinomycetota bacterium]